MKHIIKKLYIVTLTYNPTDIIRFRKTSRKAAEELIDRLSIHNPQKLEIHEISLEKGTKSLLRSIAQHPVR